MELRSVLPAAVLLGGLVGIAAAGLRSATPSAIIQESSIPSFVTEASASTAVRWDIPVVRNASVDRFVGIFSGSQSDRMALYLRRSGRYEGMIRAKLRERGMPEDLLYLSMIESGFNPTARSKAQAVGLWQFIEGTGERYGLRIDGYVDERRDPEKSTDAALRYLQDLHTQFGSWYLAAAAYNTGENRVSRIMRETTGSVRGEEQDFWRIRGRLPAETREYVPLMLAAALVGKEPEKYGLGDVERYLPVPTEAVEVPGGVPLAAVARAVGVSEKEIRKLNPQLLRATTPPGSRPIAVKIPEGRSERFASEFERARAETPAAVEPRVAKAPVAKVAAKARTHQVRTGDSLWTIARSNDTSVAALKRANGLKSNRLRPGQRLRIPG